MRHRLPGGGDVLDRDLEDLIAAADELVKHEASYVSAIAASKNLSGVRIVSGKQMGRFQSG